LWNLWDSISKVWIGSFTSHGYIYADRAVFRTLFLIPASDHAAKGFTRTVAMQILFVKRGKRLGDVNGFLGMRPQRYYSRPGVSLRSRIRQATENCQLCMVLAGQKQDTLYHATLIVFKVGSDHLLGI
jgi:hypothetical protein